MSFLKSIWPTVYKIINRFLYFLVSLIKGIFKYAFRQIKDS